MKKDFVKVLKKMFEIVSCFALTYVIVTFYEGLNYSPVLDTIVEVYAYFAIGYAALVFIKYVAKTIKQAFYELDKWANDISKRKENKAA